MILRYIQTQYLPKLPARFHSSGSIENFCIWTVTQETYCERWFSHWKPHRSKIAKNATCSGFSRSSNYFFSKIMACISTINFLLDSFMLSDGSSGKYFRHLVLLWSRDKLILPKSVWNNDGDDFFTVAKPISCLWSIYFHERWRRKSQGLCSSWFYFPHQNL